MCLEREPTLASQQKNTCDQTTRRKNLSGERKRIFPQCLRIAPAFCHSLTITPYTTSRIFAEFASSLVANSRSTWASRSWAVFEVKAAWAATNQEI